MAVMQGFPPAETDRATLANWRTRPYSAWAFHHVREVIPTAPIPHDPSAIWALEQGAPILPDEEINALLADTKNDALVILHKGKIVHESYRHGMTAQDPHILMSVSKSMLGLLSGILADKGLLDVDALLTHYVPELAGTAYAGATVRQALDMRVGVDFVEDYFVTSGPIIEYRKAANWNPLGAREDAMDLRSFQSLLTEPDGPHGGRFHYASPVTDLLGWVIERATGKRYADVMAQHLWQPLGAETAGYITVDRIGGARTAGGMCVTARDLARVAQLIVQNGARDGAQVLPAAWLDDIWNGGDTEAWDQGDFADKFPGITMHYRSKCYVRHEATKLMHGLGIHGQYFFADPARQLAIAWMSSEHDPINEEAPRRVMGVLERVRQAAEAAG